MKKITLLLAVAAGPFAACDPTLGEALDDLEAATPAACDEFCGPYIDCEWQNMGEIAGPEAESMLADLKDECAVECAYRAARGVFVYEQDWDEESQQPIYTVKERLDGGLWADYLECLVDSGLWACIDTDASPEHEHWAYAIDAGTSEACATYNACVVMLDINLEYEWNPNANDGEGDCQASGDEFLWGDW